MGLVVGLLRDVLRGGFRDYIYYRFRLFLLFGCPRNRTPRILLIERPVFFQPFMSHRQGAFRRRCCSLPASCRHRSTPTPNCGNLGAKAPRLPSSSFSCPRHVGSTSPSQSRMRLRSPFVSIGTASPRSCPHQRRTNLEPFSAALLCTATPESSKWLDHLKEIATISFRWTNHSTFEELQALDASQKLPNGRDSFLDTRVLLCGHFRRFPKKFIASPQRR